MIFSDLISDIKTAPFATLRIESDNYFEAVICNKDIPEFAAKLNGYFGSPIESSKKLSSKSQETIAKFGGIDPGQTLYFWSEGDNAVFAMLWPWQDEKHTTLKIIKI